MRDVDEDRKKAIVRVGQCEHSARTGATQKSRYIRTSTVRFRSHPATAAATQPAADPLSATQPSHIDHGAHGYDVPLPPTRRRVHEDRPEGRGRRQCSLHQSLPPGLCWRLLHWLRWAALDGHRRPDPIRRPRHAVLCLRRPLPCQPSPHPSDRRVPLHWQHGGDAGGRLRGQGELVPRDQGARRLVDWQLLGAPRCLPGSPSTPSSARPTTPPARAAVY